MSVSEWTKQDKLTNVFFFFNDTATTEIYTLSLHDALPISRRDSGYHLPVLKRFGHFDRRVWLLLVAMLAFRFGQGMYFPFSTIHFHNVVGIPLSLVGVGLATLAVASVASGLLSGPLSDRYGRKPVMLAALAGSAAAFSAFAFVEGFAGYLLVSAAAGLAGNTTFDAARNAMVADVTEPGLRARAYGLVRVGGNVGWALGPLTAGLTAASAGSEGVYRTLFLGASALMALVGVALGLAPAESAPAVLGRAGTA